MTNSHGRAIGRYCSTILLAMGLLSSAFSQSKAQSITKNDYCNTAGRAARSYCPPPLEEQAGGGGMWEMWAQSGSLDPQQCRSAAMATIAQVANENNSDFIDRRFVIAGVPGGIDGPNYYQAFVRVVNRNTGRPEAFLIRCSNGYIDWNSNQFYRNGSTLVISITTPDQNTSFGAARELSRRLEGTGRWLVLLR